MTVAQSVTRFQFVQASTDPFLALFPHRFDYIWADFPQLGEAVKWKTEIRHALSDRLIHQGAYLYGVRFGAETSYGLLDIDQGSPYHPQHDPFAIARIRAALEPLGLVSDVACTSSYSHGLHLYFPLPQPQSSWKLAIAISTLLENAGFLLKPGQLEVFPDPKPYSVTGQPSLFNAHRLPLQVGSYLVNEEYAPIWSTQQTFVQQWHLAQARNEVDSSVIRQILKQAKRDRYRVSTKAEKFINDLNAEIELGWTDFGQTNYLLGRITMREYVFRHILTGGQPLTGELLVDEIVNIAQALPGYGEYCRHRHEIRQRAQEWARCIETSHYFHYGDAAGKFKAKVKEPAISNAELDTAIAATPNWNQQQLSGARDRIRWAIAQLLEQDTLPANATARFRLLVQSGIGGGTLYKHRDLWHPSYFTELEVTENGSSELEVSGSNSAVNSNSALNRDQEWDCCEAASHSHCSPSLFLEVGSNPATDQPSSDLSLETDAAGRNSDLDFALDQSAMNQCGQQVRQELNAIQAARRVAIQLAYEQQQHLKAQAAEARQIARMQQFWESNDPILMAEAIAWAEVNPGVLKGD